VPADLAHSQPPRAEREHLGIEPPQALDTLRHELGLKRP
jgi:hypothetical protein